MVADSRYEPLLGGTGVSGLGDEHIQPVVLHESKTANVTTSRSGFDDAENPLEASKAPQSWFQAATWGRSWHILLKSGALTASLVLLINVVTLVIAYTRFTVEDHLAVIWTGDCGRAGTIVTSAHLIINILGSLLLAASNASMQALGSPTRREVDVAHSMRIALDIGVSSYRNLLRVSPLKTLATNNYYAIAVAPDFAQGSSYIEFANGTDSWQLDGMSETIAYMQRLAQNNGLQRLGRPECIRAYARELVLARRNLLMVMDSPDIIPKYYNDTTSLLALYASSFSPNASQASSEDLLTYGWMCTEPDGGFCQLSTISQIANDASTPWIPGYPNLGTSDLWICGDYGDNNIGCGRQHLGTVSHCLSQEVEGRCSVGVVPLFLIIVCVCNVVKIAAFVLTLRVSEWERPLATQGDAIESFIDQPFTALRGRCLATRQDFVVYDKTVYASTDIWAEDLGPECNGTEQLLRPGLITHKPPVDKGGNVVRSRWSSAVSTPRWFAIYVFISGCLVATAILFTKVPLTFNYHEMSQKDVWALFRSQGLGQPLPLFSKSHGNIPIILAFFAANIPQIVLSYLYTAINNILTCMLGMAEWTSWYAAGSARGLRVSSPAKGSAQRSTYFLTLPLRWGVPNLIFFALLHWLLSQMVFAAKIVTINFDGRLFGGSSVTGVYYSPIIAIAVACLGACSMIGLLVVARVKRFAAGAPLAGNCSASIAAACQPAAQGGAFEPGLELEKLKWGVVDLPDALNDAAGHATFSNSYVGSMVPGMKYT